MVGGHIKYDNWLPTAEQVVKQCGGIPIILVTIAKALRNEASESWEDALTQLKQFDSENNLESYKMIEVSYKFLNSEEKKKLFLLCAQLNHRSIQMEDLLRYAMGLNLFNGCKKLKDVRHRLHRSLSYLKGCCLLEDDNKEGMIKMHDVIHKFASFVAFRDRRVFSVPNDGELEEWPSKNELEHFSAISLPECHLPPYQMLPAPFVNPELESFIMLRSKNPEIDASFQIPDDFFAGMRGLKLMHLASMSLSPVLISSLEALVELRTLCLDGCELSDISVIGELPMLQVLSLVGSSIVLVPKEIGNLGSTLKLLDLRDCGQLESIASGVIFRLTLLEDLRIGYSFTRWQRLEGSNHKRRNIVDETNGAEMASMEEFKNLQSLINVEIHILEYANMFPKDLVFKKLETFKIVFGNSRMWLESDYISTRTLESRVVEFDDEGSKALLTSAESLVFAEGMGSVTISEMDQKGFPKLKHLEVNSIKGIQYIAKKNYNTCIFPKLEILKLLYLDKLERICEDHNYLLPVGSFENLRVIYVQKCELLDHLLPSDLARGLVRLEEIRVKKCENMESIIFSRETENEEEIKTGFTHQLQVLELFELPRLISFCSFKQLDGLPSLPTPLFNKKIIFPRLEVLRLWYIKIEKIWDDHLAITAQGTCSFQNLTNLDVFSCNNLTYLFTSSMVKSLAKLEKLDVRRCSDIEEIVSTSKEKMEGEKLLLLPKLESLQLSSLTKLRRFCHADLLECQSLQKLEISCCPFLNAFNGENESSLFDEKILFPKLEELDLSFIGTSWIPNLTSLELLDCDNLSYLFTSSTVKSLAKLKQLKVLCCGSIEEIVVSRAEDIQLSFPSLDNINLKDLPKLKRFCKSNLLEFQLLRKLVIEDCRELKTFISVNDSSSADKYIEKVAFPNIEELEIVDCPSLTRICPASLVPTTLQQLERLEVRNCDKIDFFGFNNTQQLNDAFTKHISSLKYCNLDIEGLKLMKYRNQSVTLETAGSGFQAPLILFALLKSFPRLDTVVVSSYSILQVFPSEPDHLAAADGDDMDIQAKTLARIRHLELTELSNMNQIWSDHSPPKYHVNPQVLKVTDCDILFSLAPPSTTLFKNLTNLVVQRCPMLAKLVASLSIARSLLNLKKLSVTECDDLKEIVIIDDQCEELASNDHLIVFDKLEVLKLRYLVSLTSFCPTSHCNIQFPSLDRVIVEYCPKMEFFSNGVLSTPKLTRVVIEDEDEDENGDEDEDGDGDGDGDEDEDEDEDEENEGRWEGDLNSTIQQLFKEMKSKSGEENKFDRADAYVHYRERLGVTPIEGFEEFESRTIISNQILAALEDPNVNKVGIYGIEGTGKTTLAENIGAKLQLSGTVSFVVLITVSDNNVQPDLFNIQKQIARGFKIQLQGETLYGRATHLREQLKMKDKLLIILDDICSNFELEKVGIPSGTAKVKILMMSRSQSVLEDEMNSTNNFRLDSLRPNEAEKLFDKMVGGDSQYSNWPLTAQQVVDECRGIPFLLVNVARELINEDESTWEEMLAQLKEVDEEDSHEET